MRQRQDAAHPGCWVRRLHIGARRFPHSRAVELAYLQPAGPVRDKYTATDDDHVVATAGHMMVTSFVRFLRNLRSL